MTEEMSAPIARKGVRLSSELADKLVEAIAAGVPFGTAARAAGIAESTLHEWRAIAEGRQTTWHAGNPVSDEARVFMSALSERITHARAEHEAKLVQAINDAVGVVGKSGVPEWRPALELLKHHPNYREHWYPHRELEVHNSGTVSYEHQLVKQLSPDELEAAYEAVCGSNRT